MRYRHQSYFTNESHFKVRPYKGIIKENFIALIDCHKHAFSLNNDKDQCNYDSEDDEVVDINSTILEPKLTGEILGKTVVT